MVRMLSVTFVVVGGALVTACLIAMMVLAVGSLRIAPSALAAGNGDHVEYYRDATHNVDCWIVQNNGIAISCLAGK